MVKDWYLQHYLTLQSFLFCVKLTTLHKKEMLMMKKAFLYGCVGIFRLFMVSCGVSREAAVVSVNPDLNRYLSVVAYF